MLSSTFNSLLSWQVGKLASCRAQFKSFPQPILWLVYKTAGMSTRRLDPYCHQKCRRGMLEMERLGQNPRTRLRFILERGLCLFCSRSVRSSNSAALPSLAQVSKYSLQISAVRQKGSAQAVGEDRMTRHLQGERPEDSKAKPAIWAQRIESH